LGRQKYARDIAYSLTKYIRAPQRQNRELVLLPNLHFGAGGYYKQQKHAALI
jgi:hypothetical protein